MPTITGKAYTYRNAAATRIPRVVNARPTHPMLVAPAFHREYSGAGAGLGGPGRATPGRRAKGRVVKGPAGVPGVPGAAEPVTGV